MDTMTKKCPFCGVGFEFKVDGENYSRLCGIELPEKYDGVIAWQCPDCKAVWDRWPDRPSGMATHERGRAMSATQEQVELVGLIKAIFDGAISIKTDVIGGVRPEWATALDALLREREEQASELRGIDAMLERRTALDDYPTRSAKIQHACRTAGEATDKLAEAQREIERLRKQAGEQRISDAKEYTAMLKRSEARVSELEAQLQAAQSERKSYGEAMRVQLAASEEARKRAEEKLARLRAALSNLVWTASKLWDDTPKPIMSGGAITVSHPIIEEARAALAEPADKKGESDGR